MRQHRYEISDSQRQKAREEIAEILQQRAEILFAVLHGSFHEKLPFRDIDVGVYLKDALRKSDRFETESELSLELEEHLHMPVDVRILNGAPLGFQYAVTSGEPVFTRNPAAFFNYRERVWLNYLDHKYFYEQSLKDLLAS
ncbi:MAG: nucleotidyltransferase domain-containing protein [Acidobacteriota bacterium]